MSIITSDEGQQDTDALAEVTARAFKRLAKLPTGQLRAGLAEVVNSRKAKQAAADKKRIEGLRAAALEDGFDGVSGMNTALIKRTHRVISAERLKELDDEIRVSNEIIKNREALLDVIPECPVHGRCIPHAIEWVENAKKLIGNTD